MIKLRAHQDDRITRQHIEEALDLSGDLFLDSSPTSPPHKPTTRTIGAGGPATARNRPKKDAVEE